MIYSQNKRKKQPIFLVASYSSNMCLYWFILAIDEYSPWDKIIWSSTLTWITFKQLITAFVAMKSSPDGKEFPLGWLCTRTTLLASYFIQSSYNFLILISEEFVIPSLKNSWPKNLLALERNNIDTTSFVLPIYKGAK